MSCAICEIRKEKRFCPAVHGCICPQCCGEQREVTLDCPSDCPYLVQAHEHERPRSADQIYPAGLFLQVELSDQFPSADGSWPWVIFAINISGAFYMMKAVLDHMLERGSGRHLEKRGVNEKGSLRP